jgi:hypothetical protein
LLGHHVVGGGGGGGGEFKGVIGMLTILGFIMLMPVIEAGNIQVESCTQLANRVPKKELHFIYIFILF